MIVSYKEIQVSVPQVRPRSKQYTTVEAAATMKIQDKTMNTKEKYIEGQNIQYHN